MPSAARFCRRSSVAWRGTLVSTTTCISAESRASELRRRNLAGLGMGYPLVENGGGKGKALAWLEAMAAAPVAFVDDSPKQHESASRRAPGITRIHFVGATHVRRILPESPAAHHRAEDWERCEALVRAAIGR